MSTALMTWSTWHFMVMTNAGWTTLATVEVPTGSDQAFALAVFKNTNERIANRWLTAKALGNAKSVTWDE